MSQIFMFGYFFWEGLFLSHRGFRFNAWRSLEDVRVILRSSSPNEQWDAFAAQPDHEEMKFFHVASSMWDCICLQAWFPPWHTSFLYPLLSPSYPYFTSSSPFPFLSLRSSWDLLSFFAHVPFHTQTRQLNLAATNSTSLDADFPKQIFAHSG